MAVPTPCLYERLDDGVRRELTVVSAPAGFGKTTLLADWSRRSGLPVAWVSLSDGEAAHDLVVALLSFTYGEQGVYLQRLVCFA